MLGSLLPRLGLYDVVGRLMPALVLPFSLAPTLTHNDVELVGKLFNQPLGWIGAFALIYAFGHLMSALTGHLESAIHARREFPGISLLRKDGALRKNIVERLEQAGIDQAVFKDNVDLLFRTCHAFVTEKSCSDRVDRIHALSILNRNFALISVIAALWYPVCAVTNFGADVPRVTVVLVCALGIGAAVLFALQWNYMERVFSRDVLLRFLVVMNGK